MILRQAFGAAFGPIAPVRPSMTEAAANISATPREAAPEAARLRGLGFRKRAKRPDPAPPDPRDFDVALLRLFAGARRSSGAAMAMLGAVFAAIALAWLTFHGRSPGSP